MDKIIKMVVWRYGHNRNQEDREDFEQECRLVLLKERDRLSLMAEPDKTKYAYTACKNAILKILQAVPREVSIYDDDVKVKLNKSPGSLDIDDKIDAELLVRKLDTLPSPYREVLKLHFGIDTESETLEDIGERFKVSRKTVKRWEVKALEMLRRKMT